MSKCDELTSYVCGGWRCDEEAYPKKDVDEAIAEIKGENIDLKRKNEELSRKIAELEDIHKPVKNSGMHFDCLAVTSVEVFPFKEGPSLGHMKGLAQVVLNDQFVIRGLRIMEGCEGLFVSYPMDPFYKGDEFRSICNPITRALREHIEKTVIEKYNALVCEGGKDDA